MGLTIDITELCQIRQELLQNEKMKALGQMAGGIAHDFNNMLTGIMGSAEILLEEAESLNDCEKEYLNIILNTVEKAGDLTRKLLLYSRNQERKKVPFDVVKLLKETIVLLERTLPKTIRIHLNCDSGDKIIMGDRSVFETVLLNLGINAGHAMPEGGDLSFFLETIQLSSKYCDSSVFPVSPGPFLSMKVSDTGTGMTKEIESRIFDPFFTTHTYDQGTGLGLAIAYKVVEEHKGEIRVHSTLGKGTEFTILIPLVQE